MTPADAGGAIPHKRRWSFADATRLQRRPSRLERRRSKKAPAAIKHEGVHGGRRSQKGNWEALSGHNCRENAIISGTIFTAFYCQWSVQPIRSEIGYIFQLIQTGLLDPKSFHLPKSHVFPIQTWSRRSVNSLNTNFVEYLYKVNSGSLEVYNGNACDWTVH